MTAKTTEKPKAKDDHTALLVAIAKANGHPDPEAWAADVHSHLGDK
jgi:hypothetical protein